MFRINLDWDICAIRDQVNLEIDQNQKKFAESIKKTNQVCLFWNKTDSDSKNYKKDKEGIINKIDHYVCLYQKLHDIYKNKVLDNNRK